MPARQVAERLTLLLSYSEGLLARLHKQIEIYEGRVAQHPRPQFLSNKDHELVIKAVIKRFPTIEQPKTGQQSPMFLQREAIQTELKEAYALMCDIVQFHGAVIDDLMVSLTEQQFHFDAALVPQLTAQFFMLIGNYAAVIEMLSRFGDRKVIAGCFQCSYEMLQGVGEASYDVVGRFLVDFELPYKTLPVVFSRHKKLLSDAVMSLKPIFDVRYLTPGMLRKDSPYNISKAPHLMGVPTKTAELSVELLPTDELVSWICKTFALVPEALIGNDAGMDMLTRALTDGYMLPVFRAHTINIFKTIDTAIATAQSLAGAATKELKKIGKAVHGCADTVNLAAGQFHSERRQFLRGALRELHLLVADKPGLIGPKLTTILSAISFARGEILWLFRHKYAAEKLSAKKKMDPAWLQDAGLAELMFWSSMLRRDIFANVGMVRRYYTDFLQVDAKELHQIMAQGNFGDYEQKIFSSFYEIADKCAGEVGISRGKLDGLRLDLRRLGASMGCATSKVTLDGNRALAQQLAAIHYHASWVDVLEPAVWAQTSLHDLFFYKAAYIDQFEAAIQSHQQDRYLTAFAETAVSFPLGGHMDVAGEEIRIVKESYELAKYVLSKVAQLAVVLVQHTVQAMQAIDSKILPAEAVEALAVRLEAKGRSNKHKVAAVDQNRPGVESQSLGDPSVLQLRDLQEHLADACWSINSYKSIQFGGYVRLAPQEFMTKALEVSFHQMLLSMVKGVREGVPERPSVVLQSVTTYMGVLRHVEGSIDIDIITLFLDGFLNQTVVRDGARESTLTGTYITFYTDLILKLVPQGGIVVSPSRKAICHLGGDHGDLGFKAQEYTDMSELRALCALIGSYGVKQLSDDLMNAVAASVIEMKRIVTESKTELDIIRNKTHVTPECSMAFNRIRGMGEFIHHNKLVGSILTFRQLLAEASQAVYSKRIPYLYHNIQDWHSHINTGHTLNKLAFAAGIPSRADAFLIATLRPLCRNAEADYTTWDLYMMMTACALKELAFDSSSQFNPAYDAHENNAHCIAKALLELSAAAFTVTAESPDVVQATITDAQTQFLRVASVLLIRLGSQQTKMDKQNPAYRNAIYVILDRFVKNSPYLTADVLEEHFPYSLIRTSLHECYRQM